MTHQSNPELLNTVLQLLNEEGSGGFAEGIRRLHQSQPVRRPARHRTGKLAGLFPNEAFPLRLIRDILAELGNEWETG